MPDFIDEELAKLGIGGGSGGATGPAKVPAAPIPPNPYGFAPVGDGTQAVNPAFKTSATKTGAYTYYDQNAKSWVSPRPATPDILNLPRVGGATPSQGNGAAASSGGLPIASTPGAPAAQSNRFNMSTGTNGTGTQFNVPAGYQRGPSGFTESKLPGGSFSPYEINFGGGKAAAPVADPMRAIPQVEQAVNQTGSAITGGLGAALAAARQSVGVGGGQASTAPSAGQLPSGGSVVVNGVTFSPEAANAIKQTWPQELWPQAFAISARESGGNPTVNNGPTGTGATGRDSAGNPYPGGYMNNAPEYKNPPGSLGYNTVDGGLFGINSIHGLTPEQTIDPVANSAKAYQLYQSSGWTPWTGNGTIPLPPPADPRAITGTVGQGFESSPTQPTLPPVVQPPAPPNPDTNPQNGPRMGPAVSQNPGLGMPPQSNLPMAPNGFQWASPPNWATSALFPNSTQALPERALSPMGLNPATSTSGRAPGNGDFARDQNSSNIWGLPPVQPDIWARAQAGEFQNPPAPLDYQSPQSGPPVPPVIAQGNAAQRPSSGVTALPPATVGSTTPDPFSTLVSNVTGAVARAQQSRPAPNVNAGAAGNAIGGNINAGGMGQVTPPPTQSSLPDPFRILMDGPQTAHLGDRSMGYNPVEILRGNGVRSSGDSATDAVLAAQILQRQMSAPASEKAPQLQGQSTFYQGALSGQPEWMTRSDSGYSFEPGRVNSTNSLRSPIAGSDTPIMRPDGTVIRTEPGMSPAGQAQTAQGAGLASIAPTSNPGAVYQAAWNSGSAPQYASAANLPSQDALLALAAAQAEKDKEAGLGGDSGPTRGFAQGGQVSYNPNAPATQRDLAIALANFGKKEAGPAESKFSNIAQQQWNPNDDLRMRNFAAGGSVTADPLAPLQPAAPKQATTNPFMPAATPTAPDLTSPSVLDPYTQAQQQFNTQQHVRDVTNYQRQHAGLGAQQGVDVLEGTNTADPLRPGQFYDPSKLIGQRVGEITGLQNTLAGYGNPGDPADLLTQQNGLLADQTRYQRALDLQNKILGYGNPGDSSALETQHNALLQQLAPLQQIQTYQQELAALGNQRDPSTILGEKSSVEGSIKMIQDDIANAQATGGTSRFSGAELAPLMAQLASLNNEANQSQNAANRQAELHNLLGNNTADVSGQVGTLNAQRAALEAQINNTQASAAARQEAQNQLNGLINPGEDVNAGLAGVQAKLQPLAQQIKNANSAADTRSTLSNLLARSIPKFADGGSMTTQEPIVGIPARELMSHQTPQFMVGEPQTPGGPPMAEKLNIQPLNRPAQPSPLVRGIVPSLADPLRPIGRAA